MSKKRKKEIQNEEKRDVIRLLPVPTQKQMQFLLSTEDEVLYGGAAGGGKSAALLMFSIARRLQIPGSHGLLIRRTYPELEMSHIRVSKEWLAPLVERKLAKYSEQHKRWDFWNGSTLQFGYAEYTNDLFRYQSAEFEDICIDEASQFTEYEYKFLMSRLRTTKNVKTYMRLASNPGGVGHKFLRDRFVLPARDKTYTDPDTKLTRRFVPANLHDNPYVNPEDYVKRLSALPDELRRMYLEGDWDVFSGQVFEEFRPEIHTVHPFPIPQWWRKWIANDPGYADHFAWYWLAVDDLGNVYVYREYTNEDGERIPYSEQARTVVELTGDEEIDFVVTGMDAFNPHPETGKSIVDYYMEGGIKWGIIKTIHGPQSRKIRTSILHEYLKPYRDENDGRYKAKLRIFTTCKKLIETLPMLEADKNDPETVAKSGIDHWYDALTYGIAAWHSGSATKPEKTKPIPWQLMTDEELARLKGGGLAEIWKW
jgi:hypothetical protein